jgi:fructose-1,6-bisphosphatase/inositol monophosphatase family enzyme
MSPLPDVPLPDVDAVGDAIREVAATEIMPRFGRLDDTEIWKKPAGGTVTAADTASEKRLGSALAGLLPGSVILGEEGAEADPAVFARLAGADPVWIVDPLDGTSNFAAGKQPFTMIVALAIAGEIRAGWIFDPNADAMVMASLGGGAWLDGERISLATPTAPAAMSGSLGGRLRRIDAVRVSFASVSNAACCGFEYLSLARGDMHFAHYRRLKPWDHAAGLLIHGEAGGFAAFLDGTGYDPAHPAPPVPGVLKNGGLLVAPDEGSWSDVAAILRPALATL